MQTATNVDQVKNDIRARLESSGQYGKMRAMIVDAALQSMKKEVDEEGSKTKLFSASDKLRSTLESEQGRIALSIVADFLDYHGLQFTASVLTMESSFSDVRSPDAIASFLRRKPFKSSSCVLLEVLEGGNETTKETYSASDVSKSEVEESVADSSDSDRQKSSVSSEKRETSEDESDASQESGESTQTENEEGVSLGKGAEDSTYFVSKWRGRTVTRWNRVTGQQVQLEYLEDCKVRILDNLDSATVDDCTGGELIIAACEGSVFLRNCKDMTVHVACKQLRLRDCENLDVRLFTTTDPVIEMSHHISFRPFHLRLPNLTESFKASRLDPKTNRFVHVYDFTEDNTSLAKPHSIVRFPQHELQMEDRCRGIGTPVCPVEIEDLLALKLMPAASSESGENKSYNIKTGSKAWTGQSPVQAVAAVAAVPAVKPVVSALSAQEEQPAKPPLSVPSPVRATPGGLDDEEYSDFEDSSENESDDKCSVDEDDDEF